MSNCKHLIAYWEGCDEGGVCEEDNSSLFCVYLVQEWFKYCPRCGVKLPKRDDEGKVIECEQNDTILDEAKALVTGDRNAAYGPPNQDFQRTASMWTGLLQFKLKDGEVIRAQDVAWMMMMMKASRAQHSGKRDNYVDAAGYAYCGWRCEESES